MAVTARDQQALVRMPQITFFGAQIADFDDSAALVMECDLVICVDTAAAHLAGSLGRPVWILLPYSADWRWQIERDDSPWYPSARLFRQKSPGDWSGVIGDVARALAAHLAEPQTPVEKRVGHARAPDARGATREAVPRPRLAKPQSGDALRAQLMRAMAQHQRGELGAAIAAYRAVLQVDARQFDALRLLGAALLATGACDAALPVFARALALTTNLAEVWLLQGEALARPGRSSEAVASLAALHNCSRRSRHSGALWAA